MTALTCFKAYDVRGQLGTQLNGEIVYRIGRAFGIYLQAEKVVVGGDVRLSSTELKQSLIKGLLDAGVNVLDLGMTGTEEIYFATSYLEVDGGIEVTASHNPIDYNGLKFVGKASKPISIDTGLNEIKNLAEQNNFPPVTTLGTYQQTSVFNAYIDHLLTYINLDNLKSHPLKLVINSGNGAAGHVIDALEQRFQQLQLPITFIKIHNDPDGTFPHGIPNPILPENRKDTIDAVQKNQADLGIAFDGDFDRCFFFDHQGTFIEGYYIVGLLAEAFLHKIPNAKIIYDPRLTWNTIELVTNLGGTAIMSKSGHSFIKEKMRETNAIYGGEMSAHHYFKDFFYCDSGMIPWLLVIELLAVTNQSLKDLVSNRMHKYPSPGEINIKIANPQKALACIKDHYAPTATNVSEVDGISIEFPSWRFNLRSSNTEPVVRLNLETKGDTTLMKEKTQEVLTILHK